MFGIKSDGVTLNTRSIQRAVDYISEQGGGRLIFYVGRYLTGSIELKSNVTTVSKREPSWLQFPPFMILKGLEDVMRLFTQTSKRISVSVEKALSMAVASLCG